GGLVLLIGVRAVPAATSTTATSAAAATRLVVLVLVRLLRRRFLGGLGGGRLGGLLLVLDRSLLGVLAAACATSTRAGLLLLGRRGYLGLEEQRCGDDRLGRGGR